MNKKTYRQDCENWTRAVFENVDFEWHQGDNEEEFVEAVMSDIEMDLDREGRLIEDYAPAEVTAFHLFIKTGSTDGEDVDPNFEAALEFLNVSKSVLQDVDRQQGKEAAGTTTLVTDNL